MCQVVGLEPTMMVRGEAASSQDLEGSPLSIGPRIVMVVNDSSCVVFL